MADAQITFRLDTSVRDEVANLVKKKKYRNQTDFIVQSILEKLERERGDPDLKMAERFIEVLRSNPRVQAAFDQAVRDANDRTA